jgi:hypothetical protein
MTITGYKFCRQCKKLRPFDYFKKNGSYRDRARYYKACNDCYLENWQDRLIRRVRKGTDLRFVTPKNRIDKEYLNHLYKKQKGKCYWLGIDISLDGNSNLLAISLDRKDNLKTYIKGNVVLSTRFANLGRHIATFKEMKAFVNRYIKINM